MTIDTIHNYYETLVEEQITETDEYQNGEMDQDLLEDIACLSLNQLPTKYVRYSVDLIFYMSQTERNEMHTAVDKALRSAIKIACKHKGEPKPGKKK